MRCETCTGRQAEVDIPLSLRMMAQVCRPCAEARLDYHKTMLQGIEAGLKEASEKALKEPA